ncbi:replicative DNA helicase [Candidatus Uhrbacteria bacterium]|nr:replicative DNA helicase [Candidatus Uhrbacteria bacterium]
MERIPPQNIEAEQSLLGCLLIDKDGMVKLLGGVRPEDFYTQAHQTIFESMEDLYESHQPIDLLTLTNHLQNHGSLETVGGRSYLVHLSTVVPTAAHIQHYANIISRKATLRRLITAASTICEQAYDESREVDVILDDAEQKLFSVSQRYLKHVFVGIKTLIAEAFERIDILQKNKGDLRGVPTGFSDLDFLLAGLQKSDFVILAARPSVGKTSLALDIARNAAVGANVPVGIFSLEMSKEQLIDRLICAQSGIDLWKLRTGRLSDDPQEGGVSDFDRLRSGLNDLAESPIYIDDSGSANIMEIRTKARRLQMEKNLGLLIIDYLQLMEGRGKANDGRVQEVSEISRSLKALARELNIPVLALSQLSRAAENRIPAIPKLSDLRESGSIEQDADVVMFIYRKIMDKGLKDVPTSEKYVAEVHVAKHRNGPTGQIELFFDEERASFKNLEKHHTALDVPF